MPLHIYGSSTFNAGGTRIKLQQVLGYGSSQVSEYVKLAVTDAKDRLLLVLGYQKYRESIAFQKYFNPQALEHPFDEDVAASTVKSVLQKMALGLSANHGIKIVDLAQGKYGYVSNYGAGHQGDIHLAKGPILAKKLDLVAMTYIHEASHKFAQTKDHGGRGYLASRNLEYAEPGLTWSEALDNADSYAGYVIRLSNTLRHHGRAPLVA